MLRFFPLPEIIIVAALAAVIVGPRTVWRMRWKGIIAAFESLRHR